MYTKTMRILLIVVGLAACNSSNRGDQATSAAEGERLQQLGRSIFMDTNLSNPAGQACASCHDPKTGFSDPRHDAVSLAADFRRSGRRNAVALAYSLFSPQFSFSKTEQDFIGGQFWDGAAADLEAQARRPFFSPLEMNLGTPAELVSRLQIAPYADELRSVFGDEIFTSPETTLTAVTQAIAAFENGPDFQTFSSKYDLWVVNRATLTDQELRGLSLFEDPQKGNCAACHPSHSRDGTSRQQALFTDFTYDNIGLPANLTITGGPDLGLAEVTGRADDNGRFRVPTLRNVAITGPYFHNGVMATLEDAVHFYNARDVDGDIAAPEVPETINREELGNLGLNRSEEEDIVAFLGTLTDGFGP